MEYRRQLESVEALEAVIAQATGLPMTSDRNGVVVDATVDNTLQDLVRTCVQAAQIQDKFMESLLTQLQFARDRLQQAHRLQNLHNSSTNGVSSKPLTEATNMVETIKQQSLATHDAAQFLDSIVAHQEGAIRPSTKDSVLRSQAMQVR